MSHHTLPVERLLLTILETLTDGLMVAHFLWPTQVSLDRLFLQETHITIALEGFLSALIYVA